MDKKYNGGYGVIQFVILIIILFVTVLYAQTNIMYIKTNSRATRAQSFLKNIHQKSQTFLEWGLEPSV